MCYVCNCWWIEYSRIIFDVSCFQLMCHVPLSCLRRHNVVFVTDVIGGEVIDGFKTEVRSRLESKEVSF